MKPYVRVDVKPQSAEWHKWRSAGIGASDAPIIMGDSPYLTPLQYFEVRTGKRPPVRDNPAMARGRAFESTVRYLAGIELTMDIEADVCVESAKFDVLRASLDGFNESDRVIVEIKMVGQKAYEQVVRTCQPLDHHRAQLAQQAYIVNADRVIYVAYTADAQKILDIHLVEVLRDKEYENDVVSSVIQFAGRLNGNYPPPLSDRDVELITDERVSELSAEYRRLKTQIAFSQDRLKSVNDELWSLIGDTKRARCNGLAFSTIERKGEINYKDIPQLKGVDLEQFRGKPKPYRQIRLVDNEKD